VKRCGNLWTELTSYSNLLRAARQAQKGKRFRENVLDFNYHLESELEQLQSELRSQTYEPGEYHTFRIFDPKPRLISAAPYRDRVVHHALCNLIIPPIDRTFINTSYANRIGYGSHRALQQFTTFARSSRYVLQCDIRKYFPCIDHEILKSQLHQKIKCAGTVWLIDLLVSQACFEGQKCRQ
jgi:RNA-directed DNA polymerase